MIVLSQQKILCDSSDCHSELSCNLELTPEWRYHDLTNFLVVNGWNMVNYRCYCNKHKVTAI
ncbi:MAG: hypothetical protein AABY22_35020 [Nanoarchaeota archaeon]